MRRVITLLTLLTLTLILAFPAAAQPSDWSVYLFENVSQQLIRVYGDGTKQAYDLGLAADTYVAREAIDFSPDGNRIGYCTSFNTANGSRSTLIIRDITNATPQSVNLDLGMAQGCWVKFNADASQIAVGLVRYYAGDTSADTSVPPWSLVVIDAATGNQLHEMNAGKGSALLQPDQTIMPQVRYFADNQIIFTGVAWGTEGVPTKPAYLWTFSDDSLQPIDRWWNQGITSLGVFGTGELAWIALDPNLPAAEPGGPLPQANVVKFVHDVDVESTVYSNPDWVLLDTKFIDNGRQLAIHELQGADLSSTPGSQSTRWISLTRDGSTIPLLTSSGYSDLAAAPDGYVILWASDNSATPFMSLDYYSGREKSTLWQQQGSGGITWSLLWSSPTATAEALPSFPTLSP